VTSLSAGPASGLVQLPVHLAERDGRRSGENGSDDSNNDGVERDDPGSHINPDYSARQSRASCFEIGNLFRISCSARARRPS
jgi:hypothetical protein